MDEAERRGMMNKAFEIFANGVWGMAENFFRVSILLRTASLTYEENRL